MSLLSDWLPALKQRSVESRRAKKFQRELYDLDSDAQETIVRVKDQTMMDPESCTRSSWRCVTSASTTSVATSWSAGCGEWRDQRRGADVNQLGSDDRRFYLYDTLAGMPRPARGIGRWPRSSTPSPISKDAGPAPICPTGVTPAPASCVTTWRRCPMTRRSSSPGRGQGGGHAALLAARADRHPHLDTDWYESTRHRSSTSCL